MRLSKRIHIMAEKVCKGETVADIGTDHGYVPMLLYKNKVIDYAIMSDISSSSLKKAKETFLLSKIYAEDEQFRVGFGLDTLRLKEVDDIIIGGLGGNTIIEILDNDLKKSLSFKKSIFQPRKHSGNLRKYLYKNGWNIIDEDLAKEGNFICEIITAVPSEKKDTDFDFDKLNNIQWSYPNYDYISKRTIDTSGYCKLYQRKIQRKIRSIDEEINNRSKSAFQYNFIIELKHDRRYLVELLNKIVIKQ